MNIPTSIPGKESTPYPRLEFRTGKDIDLAVENPEVLYRVESYTETLHRINISDAMKSLKQVGDLLQLAYAGSKGFQCSTEILSILMDYQRLIKDSEIGCGKFVNASLTALKSHELALKLTEKGNFDLALKQLSNCSTIAEKMVVTSKALVEKSDNLCKKATQAIIVTSTDESISNDQKKRIEKALKAYEANEASLRSKTKDLEAIIVEERTREIKALKTVSETEQKNLIFSAISTFGKSIASIGVALLPIYTDNHPLVAIANSVQKILTEKFNMEEDLQKAEEQLAIKKEQLRNALDEHKNKLNEEIAGLVVIVNSKNGAIKRQNEAWREIQDKLSTTTQTASDRAADAAKKRFELQHEQIKANADLAELVSKLHGLKVEDNNLSQAVASLEITINTLGKIKTIFENTRMFWEGVKDHCENLINIRNLDGLAETEFKNEFLEAIKSSGLNWLTLGKINLTACRAMEGVDQDVDHIMNNLPSKQQAAILIQPLVMSIKTQITKQQRQLTATLSY